MVYAWCMHCVSLGSHIEVDSLRGLELVGRPLELVGRPRQVPLRSPELTLGWCSGAES